MRYLLWSTIGLVVSFGATSAAEPVPVTAGFVNFTDEPGSFDVAGGDFDVQFGWFPRVVSGTFWFDRCADGCPLGSTVAFDTTTYAFASVFDGFGGSVNGVSYPQLFRAGEVTFVGPTVMIPTTLDEFGQAHMRGAFTFHGTVTLFTDEAHSGTPVFSRELTGQGIADVFGSRGSKGTFIVDDLEYVFSPIPEPSTLTMLLSGALGAAAALGRRRWNVRGRRRTS